VVAFDATWDTSSDVGVGNKTITAHPVEPSTPFPCDRAGKACSSGERELLVARNFLSSEINIQTCALSSAVEGDHNHCALFQVPAVKGT
jgi:hypothetical protein